MTTGGKLNMLHLAPTGLVMPEPYQHIFTALNGAIAAVAIVMAVLHWRRHRSPIPLLLVVGGAFAAGNEAIVDVLGLCWFPDQGSIPLYRAWGVTIPLFMAPVYAWFVGGQAWICYNAFQKGVTRVGVFKLYGVFALVNIALEAPPIAIGMHAYYGPQPFVILGFPAWWAICNALMPIVVAAIVTAIEPTLPGWRKLAIVPLVPAAALATNAATVFPVWLALNSSSSPVVSHVAAVISLGLGLGLASLIGLLIARDGLRTKLSPA